jgi:hypothetical protein
MRGVKSFFLLLVGAAFPALVQAQFNYNLSGYGEKVYPLKPGYFKDYFNTGSGFGGEIRFLTEGNNSFSFEFSFLTLNLNDKKFLRARMNAQGTEWLTAEGSVKIELVSLTYIRTLVATENAFSISGLAGLGVYRVLPEGINAKTRAVTQDDLIPGEATDVKVDLGREENKSALNGGLELEVPIFGALKLFAQARYHVVFTKENTDIITGRKINGRMEFWTPVVGLRFDM